MESKTVKDVFSLSVPQNPKNENCLGSKSSLMPST